MQVGVCGCGSTEPDLGYNLVPRYGVSDGGLDAVLQQMEEMAELGFIVFDNHAITRDISDSFFLDRLIHVEGGAVEVIEVVYCGHYFTVGWGMNVRLVGIESGDIGEMEIII